ncbi:DMSO reductase anchor subunit [Meinhardsimonia xiamenensis]|jgi:DMSO reductase anchor subunit|uniref:DMSO reductase anchor subunit n=1 Tax=Meinhardsimonia xiamenensis TaxID=990712 RepID=A0A1G9BK80_9RHOB|nr:DmsC/YnfH family molybdoenzyme membrane anchor subunit [Meinhardsimonia xiamenensis]PRX34948.1 DMSO reductase anchor subunit [Meinhardsimonia xiamenensis]SDK39871.1 DMSO reductase anchor subunit [Meinhardsimonia xiamenensis]
MHPAVSVILFTTLSGAGFGLFAWLGTGRPPVTGWPAFWFYFMGYGLAVTGLFASAFHLANPKNAIKAFSQWRSSWLSREAVLSVATLLVIAPYAIGRIFYGENWAALGLAGSILSILTVFSTAMIYTQLRTVPRWNTPLTPLLFLAYAVTGGAILAGQSEAAIWLLLALGLIQLAHWMLGDSRFAAAGHDMGTATGLGRIGRVRLLEPPHSGGNYLLHEMVFRIGRRHAMKLRVLAFLGAVALPLAILLAFGAAPAATALAAAVHLLGTLASRWLFFAEARHVVGLYYGR